MRGRAVAAVVGVFIGLLCCVSGAGAASVAPAFSVRSLSRPSFLVAGGSGLVTVLVTNVGGGSTDGEPIRVTDTVPHGLVVSEGTLEVSPGEAGRSPCEHTASSVSCVYEAPLAGDSTVGLEVAITVSVEPDAGGVLENRVSVSGAGVPPVSHTNGLVVDGGEPGFGLDGPFEVGVFDSAGLPDSQAGDHPNSSTTGLVFNSVREPLNPEVFEGVQEIKDVSVLLPPGLVGDPLSAPTCPEYLIAPPSDGTQCPTGSVVGSVAVMTQYQSWGVSGPVSGNESVKPLYNVAPAGGYPAEFAFIFENQEAVLYASLVHTPAGYAIRVTSGNIVPEAHLTGVKVTFFGDPAGVDGSGNPETPFFTNPVDCDGGPLVTRMDFDSWQDQAVLPMNPDGSPDVAAANFSEPEWQEAVSVAPAPTGCDAVRFAPEFVMSPTAGGTDVPSGLNAVLKIPQNPDPSGFASSELKNATVALPKGLVVSPSSANGLEACSDEQFAVDSTVVASCPEASQIGTVVVHTPILANSLKGQVFLGAPECDPCTEAAGDPQSGRMVRLFIQIHSDEYGVTIKIPARVSLDPASGQLVATFTETPQQPVSEFEFSFKSGPRAPLSTPASCGSYAGSADFTPWSTPYTHDAVSEPSFQISEGCGGEGFLPGFSAGTVSNAADGFSAFTATFSRGEGEQGLGGLQVQTPPGLLALLSSVPLCGEAQANAGSCPAASEIGHSTVVAGPGSDPLTVPEPGQPPAPVFLTGGYKGAPFGLSAVVPAVAGPFNLGTVVVRAAISVNSTTGQATITSDPLPRILDGIPLQLRTVNVMIDRPGFIFNPTGCAPRAVTATIASTQAATATVSSPFQALGCTGLTFKPKLSASTAGHASKASGASFDVKISAQGGPGGGEANMSAVKVDLPKQLPSRLTTLQRACLASVFEANPAACPKESDVGTATATTPVLVGPLSGPAYLVSHGSAKFPDLEIVLQGEGVVLVLDGHTDIKKGITSSDFNTVPDAPIHSFELKLPTGRFSTLTAYLPEKAKYDLCGQTLSMPTMITAQNGAVIKQTTKITVTNCPKPKTKAKAKAKKTGGKK